MGADGGELYFIVSDKEKFNELTGPWQYAFGNHSSWAAKCAEKSKYIPSDPDVIMVGYYGTDCEYSMETLIEVINWILDDSKAASYDKSLQYFDWDKNFEEVWLDLQTMPWSYPDPSFVRDIFHEVFNSEWVANSPFPEGITVYEWANQLEKIIKTSFHIETWT